MLNQRTLKNIIRATGVGLHTGEPVYLPLRPAPVYTGIVSCRVDLHPVVQITAPATNVGADGVCHHDVQRNYVAALQAR